MFLKSKYLSNISDKNLTSFFYVYLFLRERERQRVSGGGAERGGETQNPKQAPGSECQHPTWGWNSRSEKSRPEPK